MQCHNTISRCVRIVWRSTSNWLPTRIISFAAIIFDFYVSTATAMSKRVMTVCALCLRITCIDWKKHTLVHRNAMLRHVMPSIYPFNGFTWYSHANMEWSWEHSFHSIPCIFPPKEKPNEEYKHLPQRYHCFKALHFPVLTYMDAVRPPYHPFQFVHVPCAGEMFAHTFQKCANFPHCHGHFSLVDFYLFGQTWKCLAWCSALTRALSLPIWMGASSFAYWNSLILSDW